MLTRRGIETHYAGPTNSRGSRIIARWADYSPEFDRVRSKSLHYDDARNSDENHRAAALALVAAEEAARDASDARLTGYTVSETAYATTRGYIFGLVLREAANA